MTEALLHTEWANARLVLRRIIRTGLAGFAGGAVMGGVGSRLAMRAASMIDRSAHGSRTEAGFTVGEFTLEGTLELVIFVGLFTGLLVTPIWVIVERWLPSRGLARVAAAGVVAIGLGGRFGIEGDNFDFRILDPPLVQAAIFVLLAGATGAAVVLADRFIDRRLPVAKSETPTGGWWVLIFLGAFPTLLLIMSFFSEEISGGVSAPGL